MKKILIICTAFMAFSPIFSQESLIGDLMNVSPVEAIEAENRVELEEEFQKDLDESKAKLDETLTKLSEDYQNDVSSIIESFTKVLEKGNEDDVKNEKLRVLTKVNSLTIFLRRNKKNEVARYNSKMLIATKKLPKSSKPKRETEIKDAVEEYLVNLDKEFHANQATIENFKHTEHLIESTGVQ